MQGGDTVPSNLKSISDSVAEAGYVTLVPIKENSYKTNILAPEEFPLAQPKTSQCTLDEDSMENIPDGSWSQ